MYQFIAATTAIAPTGPFRLVVLIALLLTVLSGVLIILLVRTRKVVQEVRHRKLALFRMIVYIGTAGALAVSGFTGLQQGIMSGWALWWHMAVSPMIIIGILMVGLSGAERASLRWDATFPGNVMFWLTLSMTVVAVGAILLCMLPVFGSSDQATLYTIHKYSALLVLCSFVLHMCGCTPGKRREGNQESG